MGVVVKTPHHLDMDGHRIANLDDPTSDSEAATKGYVDRAIAAALAALEAKSAPLDRTTLESSANEYQVPRIKGA